MREYDANLSMKLAPSALRSFRRELLQWYRTNRRDLPWRFPCSLDGQRTKTESYRIWLSEVMLQQTRIAAVLPYYAKFVERFPNVQALASAREQEVLRHWAGLGYYSRARNLHRSAKAIVAKHGGEFPHNYEEALKLPGIGHYTAAAVLSIAYDLPLAVLDGNVARVLARLDAVRGDLRAPRTWDRLGKHARSLIEEKSAGDWNQAVMELGETVCTPQSPNCGACPVTRFCRAHKSRIVDRIPAPRRKRRPVTVKIAAAVLVDVRNRTLLVKDPGAHDRVLFSGMWQFPAIEVTTDAETELKQHLANALGIITDGYQELPPARHAVTFRDITLVPFLIPVDCLPNIKRSRTLSLARISTVPVSSATRKIALAALRSL